MKIRTLADIEAFEQTPAEARWRGTDTYDLIRKSALKYAERPAIKYQATAEVDEEPRIIRYRELLEGIHQTANALHHAGIAPGAVTSVIAPNLPETHFALWGAQALGIVGPINPMLEAQALRDIMIESGTEALVVLGPSGTDTIWDKAWTIVDEVPSLSLILYIANGEHATVPAKTPAGIPVREFTASLQTASADTLDFSREVAPEDIVAYFHTGGTTGTPKLARHTQANEVHMASMMVDYFNFDETSVTIAGLPLFHVNAFFNTGLNMFTCGGCSVMLTAGGFRTKGVVANLWPLVEKYAVTWFATVPTVVSALLESPAGEADISSLEMIICGAAPIAPQVFSEFQQQTGVNVIEAYGMTEGTLFSAGNPQFGEKRVGSIGIRVPYQPMKCVILDDDERYVRDCEIDEPGVIVFRGPNVFPGYKQLEKNADAFIDDWLISGDLARQDTEGYFWMTGRSKDLIIRGGHNIDPKAIEDALSEHPAVSLVGAVGQPDSYAGELPCAYITVTEDTDMESLKAYARAHIPERAAVPVHLEILDSMPMTAVGKIFKPDLRTMACNRVLTQALVEAGIEASVDSFNDKQRGLVARLQVATRDEDKAKETLGQFALSYDLSLNE